MTIYHLLTHNRDIHLSFQDWHNMDYHMNYLTFHLSHKNYLNQNQLILKLFLCYLIKYSLVLYHDELFLIYLNILLQKLIDENIYNFFAHLNNYLYLCIQINLLHQCIPSLYKNYEMYLMFHIIDLYLGDIIILILLFHDLFFLCQFCLEFYLFQEFLLQRFDLFECDILMLLLKKFLFLLCLKEYNFRFSFEFLKYFLFFEYLDLDLDYFDYYS